MYRHGQLIEKEVFYSLSWFAVTVSSSESKAVKLTSLHTVHLKSLYDLGFKNCFSHKSEYNINNQCSIEEDCKVGGTRSSSALHTSIPKLDSMVVIHDLLCALEGG